MAWHALTHQMQMEWKKLNLKGQRFLVLCSGGRDSIVLAHLMTELAPPLGFDLTIGHFHHGPGKSEIYRDEALQFCQKWTMEKGLPFLFKKSKLILNSEEEMRHFRRQQALLWQRENNFDRILLAHHSDDLLETRFFRVLRGTGVQGIEAMKVWEKPWWRPFLGVSSVTLQDYLNWHQLSFCNDPSNQENSYRRNWIRNELFPSLERNMPGSLQNMQFFFDRLVSDFEDIQQQDQADLVPSLETGISRSWIMTLSVAQQKRTLAQALWGMGVRNFRQTQINEVLKHLDISQNEHTFSAAGCDWQLNAGQILARRQVSPDP